MLDGVAMNPKVCHGKPVIAGTRVLVSTVLGALAGGDTVAMVADDYGISSKQVGEALAFAAKLADHPTLAYDDAA